MAEADNDNEDLDVLDLDTNFEDDLLEDFSDLFPDDESGGRSNGANEAAGEESEELDSLLEGFDAGQTAAEEVGSDDSQQVDLSQGLDSGIALDEEGISEAAGAVDETTQAAQDLFAEQAEGETAPFGEFADIGKSEDEDEDDMKMKRVAIVAMVVAVLALAAAGWGIYTGMDSDLRLGQLQGEMEALSMRKPVAAAPSSKTAADPRLNNALTTLADIDKRVNELAKLINGPMSHLQAGQDEREKVLVDKLAQLEVALKGLEQRQQALSQRLDQGGAATATKVQPAPKPTPKPTPKPAVKSAATPPSGAGHWVINLVSLSTAKQADEEVKRVEAAGLSADVSQADQGGKSWYRVRVPGYASYDAAKADISRMNRLGFSEAWVSPE